mgnify:CR=1 FL=1
MALLTASAEKIVAHLAEEMAQAKEEKAGEQ